MIGTGDRMREWQAIKRIDVSRETIWAGRPNIKEGSWSSLDKRDQRIEPAGVGAIKGRMFHVKHRQPGESGIHKETKRP